MSIRLDSTVRRFDEVCWTWDGSENCSSAGGVPSPQEAIDDRYRKLEKSRLQAIKARRPSPPQEVPRTAEVPQQEPQKEIPVGIDAELIKELKLLYTTDVVEGVLDATREGNLQAKRKLKLMLMFLLEDE